MPARKYSDMLDGTFMPRNINVVPLAGIKPAGDYDMGESGNSD
jgi:hypothetical protein